MSQRKTYPYIHPTLVAIDQVSPAAYNPRKVDPERLARVRLSLQKLGWLSPVYSTKDGQILSGHQRTHVARQLGYAQVPVVTVPDLDDNRRRAVNILFNRSTNDMDRDSSSQRFAQEWLRTAALVKAAADRLPDHPLDHFPCLETRPAEVSRLVKINRGGWVPYARSVALSIAELGIGMPIILDKDDRVINGIGRLQLAAERNWPVVPALPLDEARADLARPMLNLLSMDFDVTTHYSDYLRHNSFRRERNTRATLGRGFTFAIFGTKPCQDIDIFDPSVRERWAKVHGRSILDFGAGHLHETHLLRRAGFDVTPFEPYHTRGNRISKEESRKIALGFLADVAAGKQWSSIFCSSVLNSVPFRRDREAIVKIISACASPHTRCYFLTLGLVSRTYANINRKMLDKVGVSSIQFGLDYEPGVILGDLADSPKVQKFHTVAELHDLVKSSFTVAQTKASEYNICSIGHTPKPLAGLKDALEFEFDLPYPDGTRMGLVGEAVAAFTQRLGKVE